MNLALPRYRNHFHPAWLLLPVPPLVAVAINWFGDNYTEFLAFGIRTVLIGILLAAIVALRFSNVTGTGLRLLKELAPDEEKFYAEGAKEVEEEIRKLKKEKRVTRSIATPSRMDNSRPPNLSAPTHRSTNCSLKVSAAATSSTDTRKWLRMLMPRRDEK